MSLIVSASQRCSVSVSMMLMGVGLGWRGPGVKGEAEPANPVEATPLSVAVSRRAVPGVPWRPGNCRAQRPALRVVPQLPKGSWVVRVGRSRTQTDNTLKQPSRCSHYSSEGLPSTNYPYTTQMGFLGSALGSEIEQTLAVMGSFGERGGTRTLDPMIKSHVLGTDTPRLAAGSQGRVVHSQHRP
jgi:hypothetical protein